MAYFIQVYRWRKGERQIHQNALNNERLILRHILCLQVQKWSTKRSKRPMKFNLGLAEIQTFPISMMNQILPAKLISSPKIMING
ncbi:MAG: hypothetical protein CL980_05765 [Euryarchaeota archaeon]|nr:hypothetical protein [Euryarchaeota archaeon]